MEIIESLLSDHERLRRRMAELEASLGPEIGVGWSDCAQFDRECFCRAVEELLRDLLEHEAREELELGRVWAQRGRAGELDALFRTEHAEINELVGLLRAAAACCDGRHVYSVRSVVHRLREGLEAHMRHEERDIFPRVRRPSGRPGRAMR